MSGFCFEIYLKEFGVNYFIQLISSAKLQIIKKGVKQNRANKPIKMKIKWINWKLKKIVRNAIQVRDSSAPLD